MKKILIVLFCLLSGVSAWASCLPVDARIEAAMFGEHRSEANIERNRYRHPVGTLTFLGLEDGMTVMEIWPGGGWYTEILAPVMKGHGKFIVAGWDVDVPDQPGYRYSLNKAMLEKFAAESEIYGEVGVVAYSPPQSASLGEADSIDLLLTFRNTHGWINDGLAKDVYAEFARVLKPGGVLGVVQHRADEGADAVASAKSGYVPEAAVIAMAEAAGLVFEARSEVNANPRDDHQHESGVWTLPPSLSACRKVEDEAAKAECEAKYRAIGESDRMTLKFRKPAN
jgi:predicted methyltransferase